MFGYFCSDPAPSSYVNIGTYFHEFGDDGDDDEHVVDVDVVGDVVFLSDVAFKHTAIKEEVWMEVTMMITVLVGR